MTATTIAAAIIGKKQVTAAEYQAVVDGLESSIAYLAPLIKSEEDHPSREDQRDRLLKLADAAEVTRKLATDPIARQLLRRGYIPLSPTETQVSDYLDWLVRKARSEVASIRRGAGVGLHVPAPDALSAHGLCAAIVVVAWQTAHGRLPPHTNAVTQGACDDLWQAAGGPVRAANSRSAPTGWRRHIEAAKLAYREGGGLPLLAYRFLGGGLQQNIGLPATFAS